MKKVLVAVLVVAIAMIGASAAMAAISGSKHDLATSLAGNLSGQAISSCQYCHAPHNPTSQTAAPLWNRTTATYAKGYAFYSTLAAEPTGNVGEQSMTCLSCHDGVTAMTAVANAQKQAAWGDRVNAAAGAFDADGSLSAASTANIGSGAGLSNDHPVGIDFAVTGTYAGVVEPTVTIQAGKVYGVPATGGGNWRSYGAAIGTSTIECSSCHDPHGDDYSPATANSPFLRGSIQYICSDCHTTK